MDVHKSFLVACIATTNDPKSGTSYKSKRFSTFTGNLRRCAAWLAENVCRDVCTESTGKYWIPIFNILEPTYNIVLAHPKYVKSIRSKKLTRKTQNGLPISSSTTKILENPAEKITDVSCFRTKGMKVTNEQVLAAIDEEMCVEQTEKLRIIRSHMDSLELCKLNLQFLILTTAEKYLPQINLVYIPSRD